MTKDAISTFSISEAPLSERPLAHLFYYNPNSHEDELSDSLRGLRSLLLATMATIDHETDEYIMTGENMRELLCLAFDLADNANKHADSWSNEESKSREELKKRADQLPEADELWIKCNIVADRHTSVVEKTAAIEGMLAQIKPVIITSYNGTKSIVDLQSFQVRKGWSGESVKD